MDRGEVGIEEKSSWVDIDRRLMLAVLTQLPIRVDETPKVWPWKYQKECMTYVYSTRAEQNLLWLLFICPYAQRLERGLVWNPDCLSNNSCSVLVTPPPTPPPNPNNILFYFIHTDSIIQMELSSQITFNQILFNIYVIGGCFNLNCFLFWKWTIILRFFAGV